MGTPEHNEALPPGSRVTWLRVLPRLHHAEESVQNPGTRTFSNVVYGGPRHGRWRGIDPLEYDVAPLQASPRVEFSGNAIVLTGVPETRGLPRRSAQANGAGTIFLAADVQLPGGARVATPGFESRDRLGLSESVARVSFRSGDDFLGFMSSYFGVPFLFGSTPHQVDRYVGVDCADVMIAAQRAAGRAGVFRRGRRMPYVSVSGISRHARAVTPPLRFTRTGTTTTAAGEPITLRFGDDVKPGDMIAIDYARSRDMPRSWDHIGALVADTSGDGVLNGGDTMRHMGLLGLTDESIRRHGPIRFRVWRWKHRYRP